MRRFVWCTLIAISSVLLTGSFGFSLPVEISYQGYLTDRGGVPVNGTTNITFKLFDNHDALQWDSGAVAVDAATGVYSVILGASPQPAINPAIFIGELWLAVSVENDTEMTPRQKLTAVPHSIRAGSAETADTVPDGAVTDAKITGTISAAKLPVGSAAGTVAAGDHAHAPDGDGDPANELNTSLTMAGTSLHLADPGSTLSLDLAEELAIDNLSDGKYDGSSLFLGAGAGANDDGDNGNVGVGTSALFLNTSGAGNTAVGFNANYYNQTGSNNTMIGFMAGRGAATHSKSGNIFIGYSAGYNEQGSNLLYIDNSTTDTPLIYGDFATDAMTVNGTMEVASTAAIGSESWIDAEYTLHVRGGAENNISGYFVNHDTLGEAYGVSAHANASTARNEFDRHYGVAGASGGGKYNYGLHGTANSSLATTNYGVYGEATFGSVNYAGYFEGDLAYTGALINASDRRLKENITPIENALAKVERIRGIYYNRVETPGQTEVGVIAQDIEKVLPEAVHVIDPEKGYLGVDYPRLIPVLIESVKEQQAMIKSLAADNEALKLLVCRSHLEAEFCR